MKKIVDDWRLIYKVCSLYYEDDMRQQEISDYLGISRATISRMLQKGKESGIVRVEVVNPIQFTYGKLEKTLERKYGLKDVIVVENSSLDTRQESLNKMYEKAIKSQNKLFQNLYSNEKTISWIIDRWINTFLNLTTNSNYRDYIDIKNLKVEFIDENYGFNDDKLELGIEFEKVKKLSKKEKIKLLKEVWKEARYDDFDEQDMLYLAEKLGLKLNEVFDNCGDLIKLNLKKEQDESGNSQLVIVF